jgi:hypothetical protein
MILLGLLMKMEGTATEAVKLQENTTLNREGKASSAVIPTNHATAFRGFNIVSKS